MRISSITSSWGVHNLNKSPSLRTSQTFIDLIHQFWVVRLKAIQQNNGVVGCSRNKNIMSGLKHVSVPSGKLTWQWNITNFNRKYIFKGSIFHGYVSLPECTVKRKQSAIRRSETVGCSQNIRDCWEMTWMILYYIFLCAQQIVVWLSTP